MIALICSRSLLLLPISVVTVVIVVIVVVVVVVLVVVVVVVVVNGVLKVPFTRVRTNFCTDKNVHGSTLRLHLRPVQTPYFT